VRVAVIGAGIVGVTTAYEAAHAGHQVVVFERRGTVAAEASFANAGVVAPGYITPWAAPGMPWKVLRQLFNQHAPVRLGGLNVLKQVPWIWRWLRACHPAVHSANREAMQRLGHFSRDRLLELTRTLRLEYEQMPGYLVLLRDPAELASARRGLALLREWGVAHDVVDGSRCRHLEPALNPEAPLHAAIHLPTDGLGNCRQFAHLIKVEAQRLGAEYRFDAAVTAITPGTHPGVQVAGGARQDFDAVVMCTGVGANELLSPIGLKLPLAPVYGCSVTAPIRHVDGHPPMGPRAALMDERYKVAISRLGQRIRIAGGAEIGGSPDRIGKAPLRTLYRVLDEWFPGAALTATAQYWKGARPMLPDGPPVLGESGMPGIWLNLGHGSSGWALACGSALVLAERLSDRASPVDMKGLTLDRWRKR
jgi:D-amino-acid dehydrogenase